MIMDTGEKLRFSEGQKFLLELVLLEVAALVAVKKPRPESQASTRKSTGPQESDKSDKNEAREILWNRLLTGVKEKKIPTHALLSQGRLLGTKGDVIYIGYRKGYKFHKERMEEKENMDCKDWFFCTKKLGKEEIMDKLLNA